MLESIFDDMLKSKVLSPDDVGKAESADAFLTQKKDSLSVLVAANLMSAIYRLLCNVTAVRARRTWVLQANTLFGINYEAVLPVADVARRYIGMSAASFCDHDELARARWGRHFYELSTESHCNPGFQQAFGSASLPSPAHGRTPSSPPLTGGRGSRRSGWSVRLPHRSHVSALFGQRLRLASGTRLPVPERRPRHK